MDDWMDFVKEKTSAKFLAKSEKFKEMKKKQLPHTCSHKGYARLAEEMNTSHEGMSTDNNVVDDAISKALGPDRGYVRGYGHGVTKSKFLSMSQNDNTITFLQERCDRMTSEMTELKYLISSLLADKAKSSEQNSNHTANVSTSAHVPPTKVLPSIIMLRESACCSTGIVLEK
ncbi:uncharacterized protein LOC111025029 [Momordica charantia]|uniref:Uncharacterized protein LOC111025029 n=1 Tax=Momordica charantia TaxID=3673 RepID=A0A6J1DW81_MOMCH|nr:uncharacterized protein LOC111025029 [Momordica charantia]